MLGSHVILLLCLSYVGYVFSMSNMGGYCYGPNEVFTTNFNPNCEANCYRRPVYGGGCNFYSGRSGCTCKSGFVRHPSGGCFRLEDCSQINSYFPPYPYPRTYPFVYPYPNPYVRYPYPNPIDSFVNPYPSPFVYPSYDIYGAGLGKSKPTLSSQLRNN